jgi:hypothetical protein
MAAARRRTSRTLRWKPGRFPAGPETPRWTPSPPLTALKNEEPNQPTVYAPSA